MSEGEGLRPRPVKSKDSSGGVVIMRVSLDVRDLRAMQTELEAIAPVVFTSDQFAGKASSLDEFAAHDVTALNHLRMTASDPGRNGSVFVDIGRKQVHIFTHDRDPSPLLTGVQSRLERICRARARRFVGWCALAGRPLAVGGLAGFAILAIGALVLDTPTATWGLIAPALFLAFGLLAWIVGLTMHGSILLVKREERPGWLKRNRDTLLVQVVVGVLLLVAGIVLGRLTQT